MATAVTAVTTAPQPVPATATAPAASAAPTDPFNLILGTAVAAATPPADDASLAVGDAEADLLADPRTTDQNALALAAAGVLVVVPGITPAAPQATPTVDLDAAAVGVTTATSDNLPALAADTQSRTEQLRFQIAAGLQNQTPLTQQPDTRARPTTPPETPPATRTAVPEVPAPPAAGPNPTAATPANPLPAGVPAARTPTIPAQAPIVTDAVVVPAPPVPLTPPDVTVEATNAVAGLPDVTVGDRPSVAGERFVALANTGARLAETAPTAAPAVPFADVARDAGITPPTAASQQSPSLPPQAATSTQPTPVTTQPALPLAQPVTVVAEPVTVAPPVAPPSVTVTPQPAAVAPQTITAPVTAYPAALAPSRPEMSTDVFVTPTAGIVTETATGRATRLAQTPVAELARDADTTLPQGVAVPAPVTVPTSPQMTDAPPAVARSVPATPVAVQLTDGVVAHTRHLAATGEVEFRMRLDPPDLGQVRVNLVGSGDHVRGEVVVADDAVRRMIESQLPELRQRLEAAGVTVQRFDVTTSSDFGGGSANPNGRSADRTPTDVPPVPTAARATRPWYAAPLPASGLDVTV